MTFDSERQKHAPLAEAMTAYAEDGAAAFHTPGHKQGLGAHPLLKKLITKEGLRQEVSLMEELDNLQEPSHCIKKAQELAAELYGADGAWFMVNGTTGAIHTMLLSVLSPGDEVLVPRNAHRSMLGGILLAGAVPVYLPPEIDHDFMIPMGLSVETVQKGIEEHPAAKALAVISPTYYGMASDLSAFAELAHAHDMLLLVDEAHGAHLKFSEELPVSAIDAGADLAAQSTHKLLGSLTQTSLLLGRRERVDFGRVQAVSGMLQSTSPNNLLLASLDIARLQMAEEGVFRVGRAVRIAEELRKEIRRIPGLACPGREWAGRPGAFALDVTKLTVPAAGLAMTGMEAEEILRRRYKIQCELSDPRNLLFIISMADTEQQAEILLRGLREMAEDHAGEEWAVHPLHLPPIPRQVLSPREAFWGRTRRVKLEAAAGCISAEQIAFYPPGVPVLCPGECIGQDILEYIGKMKAMGCKVTGPEDASLTTLRVML